MLGFVSSQIVQYATCAVGGATAKTVVDGAIEFFTPIDKRIAKREKELEYLRGVKGKKTASHKQAEEIVASAEVNNTAAKEDLIKAFKQIKSETLSGVKELLSEIKKAA